MSAYRCTCGYVAASDGELGDHWGEAFIPAGDRDASGVVHAEAARDDAAGCAGHPDASVGAREVGVSGVGGHESDTAACFRCLCGEAFDGVAKLDEHLLSVFTPADCVGLDGLPHAPAA